MDDWFIVNPPNYWLFPIGKDSADAIDTVLSNQLMGMGLRAFIFRHQGSHNFDWSGVVSQLWQEIINNIVVNIITAVINIIIIIAVIIIIVIIIVVLVVSIIYYHNYYCKLFHFHSKCFQTSFIQQSSIHYKHKFFIVFYYLNF